MFKLSTDDTESQTPGIMQTLDGLVTALPKGDLRSAEGGGVPSTFGILRREGARRMIAAALEVEVEQYIQPLGHLRGPWSSATGSLIMSGRGTWGPGVSR